MLAPTLTKTKFSGYFQAYFCAFGKVLDKNESLIEERSSWTVLPHISIALGLDLKKNKNKNKQNKEIMLRAF